ncbi:hypothetical protein ACK32O_05890 [Aeromonas enteropelogenes]|uniref:hypothetical protein n=1 Tax=Aeromonas enteropelogenes TaxID=29489 RepID=UPI003987B81F
MSKTIMTLAGLKQWIAENEARLAPTSPLCCCGELGISIRVEAGHVAIDEPDYNDVDGGEL